MPNVVLVPLNGSAAAEQALPHAAALAAGGGRIVLARAVLAHAGVIDHLADARRWAIEQADTYLHSVASGLAEQRVPVETVVIQGPPAAAILTEVTTRRPDLVVMVTYGRTEGDQWSFGSVAEALLRHSFVPLLLLRAAPTAPPRPRGAPRRMLVPLDGSVPAEATLQIAGRLAGQFGAELMLLRVVNSPPAGSIDATRSAEPGAEVTLERLRAQADEYLLESRRRLSTRYPGVPTRTESRLGSPDEAIIAAGNDYGADLIVMTTRGRTGPERVVLGSVASAVLRSAALPLLLVSPASGVADQYRGTRYYKPSDESKSLVIDSSRES